MYGVPSITNLAIKTILTETFRWISYRQNIQFNKLQISDIQLIIIMEKN